MDDEYVVNVSAAAVAIVICSNVAKILQPQKKKRVHEMWVRPIFTEAERAQYGQQNLLAKMRLNDHESFFNYTRMSPVNFKKLLEIVGPQIAKVDTKFRMSINPSTRLALTLRYLASGDSPRSISYNFRIGKSTACHIISETLDAIYHELKQKVLPELQSQDWLAVAEGFQQRWNFPNCVGSIDGKHIRIIAPPDSGSDFYNYKNYFSIILMAICDYRYRFIAIDIGAQGRQSDGGVFQNSVIGKRFMNKTMNIPEDAEIFEGGPILPYYLVGDEAFGLKTWLITPYPGKSSGKLDFEKNIFNYRQSRARLVIENTFGIYTARWRILRSCLETSVNTADKIVQATVCLHNFCLMQDEKNLPHQRKYCPTRFVDRDNADHSQTIPGDWRNNTEILPQISKQGSYNCSLAAAKVRNVLAEHFMTDGSVPWQWDRV